MAVLIPDVNAAPVADTIPAPRPSVLVEIGYNCDPADVVRSLDERGLAALQTALHRCRCDRCIQLRGGAS